MQITGYAAVSNGVFLLPETTAHFPNWHTSLLTQSGQVFIGPEAPEGMEANWVKTRAGQTWFAYFRLYNPEAAFFDKTWKLNDIVEFE